MHLLQICNVGNICGGTAACAWTIQRAFPEMRHTVVFLSPPTPETARAFAGCRIDSWRTVTPHRVAERDPDVVLLHNVSQQNVSERLKPVTVQYLHSMTTPASADYTIACSDWLKQRYSRLKNVEVCYQPVPRPPQPDRPDSRSLRERLVVGRLCTPTSRKWPDELISFYKRMAKTFPKVEWEFVGCPTERQPSLRDACCGRATFHPAGWKARRHLWTWDALLYHHPHLTESFGRTAAEAMRAGCIPLVDDRGGFREQITRETGFLCSDITGFEAALQTLSDPACRRRLSRAAQTHANECFSLQTFHDVFLSRLRQL